MKINLTIEQADNGMIVRSDEYVSVIENTHSAEEGRKDNLVHELGRIFFQHVNFFMNEEITNNVEVEIEINKTEKYMKKIMFNDRYGLTQAVLEGRKTQTPRAAYPR